MADPAFVIGREARQSDGSLLPADRDRVADLLLAGGFALLPSDTSYSVGAVPFSKETRERINKLLLRDDMPVSLAFASLPTARQWLAPNPLVEALLQRFAPGPITVVCRASAHGIPTRTLEETVAGRNRTIGVRIPNSLIERDVAGSTSYPITTVAVRDPSPDGSGADDGVTSFDRARDIVAARVEAVDFPGWCGIEGDEITYGRLSTVVEVPGDGTKLLLIRGGAIPFDEIQDYARDAFQGRE